MASIFISYRRTDSSEIAGRIQDYLAWRYGKRQIFLDEESIEPAQVWRERIRKELNKCRVVLVIIGPDWANVKDKTTGKRRLNDPEDFLREEISFALKRNIPVFPVLVNGAVMPDKKDLPSDLKELTERNAIKVSDTDFNSDMLKLVKHLPWRIRALFLPIFLFRNRRKIVAAAPVLLVLLLCFWACRFVWSEIKDRLEEEPRALAVTEQWDFEDCKLEGWGVYNPETASVEMSDDVTVARKGSQDIFFGNCALEVSNFEFDPNSDDMNPHQKWAAVRFSDDLTDGKLSAKICVPKNASFRYADAKFFLFDAGWKWKEGPRTRIDPDWCKEVSWDHVPWSTNWVPILGIKIYVDGQFTGPVFVDNVTLFKPVQETPGEYDSKYRG